ncbi:MAG TPA: glycosyltransferase family 2 protein [Chitinophagaceae bacterium]|nr:glycosyltransferase family 2 protein [Chitinophagaceae bacterium]
MKVSIITVTYNSAGTLRDTLESVRDQDYPNIEHILVDGASKDDTVKIIQAYNHVAKYVSEKDRGLYDAINKGILMSTGDVVGILNSDDFFPHRKVISNMVKCFKENDADAVYGDIAFVRPENLQKVIRLYSSKKFQPKKFKYGYMPAHPSFYVKRKFFDEYGLYKLDYKIAADYELLMRFMHSNKLKCAYHPEVMVYMRTGGVSNKNILSRYVLNKEIIRACKENGVNTNMFIISLKYFNKVFEYVRPAMKI